MGKRLDGKVVVVTGGRRRMPLVLADIDGEAASATEAVLGGQDWLAARYDVSRPDEVTRMAQIVYERFGGVNLLVNSAGVGAGGASGTPRRTTGRGCSVST